MSIFKYKMANKKSHLPYSSKKAGHLWHILGWCKYSVILCFSGFLSGVPDYFDRNKILSGYDLSHYQVPHCIKSFLLFCLICANFQFYFELCAYCNILDIYLSQKLNFVNYLLFYMKLLNYLSFNMFGSVLECCELTGVSLLRPWLIKWK